MQVIPVNPIPNQSFTIRIDGIRMALRIKEARGLMVADFTREDVLILTATPLLAGETLIPYSYLQNGNFVVLTTNRELPDWRKFGSSQQLIFLSQEEIDALGLGDSAPSAGDKYLTTDDFRYITGHGELIEAV